MFVTNEKNGQKIFFTAKKTKLAVEVYRKSTQQKIRSLILHTGDLRKTKITQNENNGLNVV